MLLLSGCAHKARKFNAPDATRLREKQAEAATHVRTARAEIVRAADSTRRARASHGRAVESHKKETVAVKAVADRLESPVFQNVPLDIRDALDAVKADVAVLTVANAETALILAEVTPQLESATLSNANATGSLEQATAAQTEIETKLGPAYIAETEKMTDRANVAEEAWAKNSKEIVKLKTKSIAGRIMMAVGAVAVAALLFLWLTGKIALGAAKIAR